MTAQTTGQDVLDRASEAEATCLRSSIGDEAYEEFLGGEVLTSYGKPGLWPHSPICRLVPLQLRRNQPIRKLLGETAPTSLFPPLVQVQNGPRLVFLQLTQIPVHGYDTTSGLRSRSGRPQTGTRRPRIIACCDVAASARTTTPAGSFGSKSVEPTLSPSLDRPGPRSLAPM